MSMFVIRILVFLLGAVIVVLTVNSAIRVFVLPRSASDRMAWFVFRNVRHLFNLRMRFTRSYIERDGVLAMYAPVCLLVLLVTWLATVAIGYTCMFWAIGVHSDTLDPVTESFITSGSSLLTLGIAPITTLPAALVGFSEAAIGLILIALLISYLPTMYSEFSRREAVVTLLDVRAGSPPSAVEMIKRFNRLRQLDILNAAWSDWEVWFTQLEESHTSLAALSFFRSPQPDRSWVTAAGTVLDAAALMITIVDVPHNPQADLCIRAGYLALQRIAAFFRVHYISATIPNDPTSASHISVTREEFEAACNQLAEGNVPLKPDREQAWRDFAGWRVNYDTVLLSLAYLMMAPAAPWTSDRLPHDGGFRSMLKIPDRGQ